MPELLPVTTAGGVLSHYIQGSEFCTCCFFAFAIVKIEEWKVISSLPELTEGRQWIRFSKSRIGGQ